MHHVFFRNTRARFSQSLHAAVRTSWSRSSHGCRLVWYRFRSSLSVHGRPLLYEPLLAIGRGRVTFTGRVYIGRTGDVAPPDTKAVIRAVSERAFVGIGHNTHIGANFVASADRTSIVIGSDVWIEQGVCISDHVHSCVQPLPHGRAASNQNHKPVVLEDDVFVGAHARICGGVVIGRGARIESYALVTADVPERALFKAPFKTHVNEHQN